jgi:hypothetical protein
MTSQEYDTLKTPTARMAAYENLLAAEQQATALIARLESAMQSPDHCAVIRNSIVMENGNGYDIELVGITSGENWAVILPLFKTKLAEIQRRMEAV